MKRILLIAAATILTIQAHATTPTKRLTLDIGRPETTFVLGPISRGATEYIDAALYVRGVAYPTNDLSGYLWYSVSNTSTVGVQIANVQADTVNGHVYFQMSATQSLGLSTNASDYPTTNYCSVVLTNTAGTQKFVWDVGKLILRWDAATAGAGLAVLTHSAQPSYFTALTDAPSSYVGHAGKVATVNSNETALEFTSAGAGDITGVTAGTWIAGGATSGDAPVAVDTNAVMAAVTGKGYLTAESDTAALAALGVHTNLALAASGHGPELDPIWAAVSNAVTTGAAAGATALQAESQGLSDVLAINANGAGATATNFAGITADIFTSAKFGSNAGFAASGNNWTAVGNTSGNGASGNTWQSYGFNAGTGASGNNWGAYGFYAGAYGVHTNSVSFGRYAGRTARGNSRLYMDMYAADPSYAADGSTNDTLFLDSDGKLFLGGGPSRAENPSAGGVLRGSWDGSGLTGLTASQLTTGTIPLARLVNVTTNEMDAATRTQIHAGGGATNIVAGSSDSYNFATRTVTWNTNAAAGGSVGASALADLSDVAPLTGAINQSLLKYNGSIWTNDTGPTYASVYKSASQLDINADAHVTFVLNSVSTNSADHTPRLSTNGWVYLPSVGQYLIMANMLAADGDADTYFSHSVWFNGTQVRQSRATGTVADSSGNRWQNLELSVIVNATSTNDYVYQTLYVNGIANGIVDIVGAGALDSGLKYVRIK